MNEFYIIKLTRSIVVLLLLISSNLLAQSVDQRAENVQNGTFNIFMSADQSYFHGNSSGDNNPYGYGYWVAAHALENLADAYQRTRNTVYKDRMKSIIAGIRKYNLYGAGTYHNDYYDDLEWLCLACFNCYNATGDTEYLDAVHAIWAEIQTGYNNGAMSWSKGCNPTCKNSIANAPAIIIAVKLYQLEGDNANLQMAKDIHAWMKANVFNANGGIWDSPGNFNDGWQFSYNSGMFIGACLELSIVTGQQSYIDDGIKACEFMMNFRNYNGGVFFLNETGQGDGGLFKGIFAKWFTEFVRVGNLTQAQKGRYLQVIDYTGNYAWTNAVNKTNFLVSPDWSSLPNGTIDLSTQASGMHLFESVASLNKVHVYQNINYSGFYSQLPLGNYTLAQLQARGVSDNDITSLTIPSGYAIIAYENDNFTGASITYTANTSWLAAWNDRITSIRIIDLSGPVSAYQDINYGGYVGSLNVGDYTLAQLQAIGIQDNDITSLKIAEGYKVTLYDGDNLTGTSIDYTSNTAWLAAWNDKATSLSIRTNGATNMAGTYFLQNRNSGLFMDVWGAGTADGTNISQGSFNGGTNQQYKFTHLGDGVYQALAVHSNKSIDVDAISTADGANVQQWTYFGSANQQFIVVPTGDGYYKMIAKHSAKVIEVANASTINGGNIQQWDNENQTWGQWKFKPVTIPGSGTGLAANYFNGMNFDALKLSRVDANINFDWGSGSPNATINVDQFSTRWTGQIQPLYTDTYTFYLNSDNGRRLWINNQLVVDKWLDDWGTEYSGTIVLTAGQKYDIRLEYFEDNGGASCKMEWSSFLQDREVVPQSQLYANTLPTVSINSPANNASFNTPASITINATAGDGDGTVAKVDFYNGTTLLGSDASSPFTYTWTGAASGTYNLTALATDNRGGVTLSSIVIVKINQSPTVSITAPANNATYVASANIAISATAADADGSIAKVEFYNGTTLLGTVTSSPYSYNWTNVTAGTYTITAKAYDNLNAVTTSTAITVKVNANQNPTVSVTATSGSPNTVSISATANDPDGTITKVDYYDGATKIGTSTSSPYTFTWTGATAGNHSITAVATDDKGGTTTSSAVNITVNNPNQAPTVSITSPANNATYVASANIAIMTTAADTDGSISKVEFYNGTTLLGTVTSSPFTYNWTNVAAGSYTITAKAYDNQNAVTTSTAITVKVNSNQNPTISVSATSTSPNTVAISAIASDGDGSITKVEYYDGTTKIGEATAAPFSFTWTNVPAGTHSITAVAIDDKGGKTTSNIVVIEVEGANQNPLVRITSPVTNSTFDAPATITITADAADVDGSVTKVEFYQTSIKIGEATTSPFSFTYTAGTTGSYDIYALAIDDKGGSSTSEIITIHIDKPTSVTNSMKDLGIAMYPNPTSDLVYLSSGVESINVYNVFGVSLATISNNPDKIDLSTYASGTYILEVIKNNHSYWERIIKK